MEKFIKNKLINKRYLKQLKILNRFKQLFSNKTNNKLGNINNNRSLKLGINALRCCYIIIIINT